MDYFIMVFHNDVITPTFLNQSTWSSRKFCIKCQPEQLLISIFLNESGPPVLREQGAQVNCPICPCLVMSPGWVPLPSPANTNSFLGSLSSFILKSHCDLVPKFTCRYCTRLLIAVKFLSSHTPLKRSFVTKQILCSGERYVLLHCLCSPAPSPSVRNTTD